MKLELYMREAARQRRAKMLIFGRFISPISVYS